MNSVTHCVGVILSILGGRLLSIETRDASLTHRVSCAIYTGSLLSLYLSSTLFHSFFAMVNTRHVFRVMDKCAIYILIAGSYTPIMQISLSDQPIYSFGLLGFIWVCCVLGVTVEALYPNWKHKPMFSLSMYLGMGVSCRINEIQMNMSPQMYVLHCK
jgi:hemolysin III